MAIPTYTYYSNLDTTKKDEPVLKPVEKTGIIDVVSDFVWSASPTKYNKAEFSKKIPKVYLVEYTQELNSLLASALYLIKTGAVDTYGNALNTLGALLSSAELKGPAETVFAFNRFSYNKLEGLAKELTDKTDDMISVQTEVLGKYLDAYQGLYITKRTGFNYVLPHLTDTYLATVNAFNSNLPPAGFLSKGTDWLVNTLTEVNTFTNIFEPGTFMERPKHYQFSNEGSTITVKFPLLNTVWASEAKLAYQQNYEFLWVLAFQNKPLRTSFSRVLPPKLYQLTIPGQEHFPYCYISNLNVELVGNRRLLPVVLPGNHTCEVPIPEAYNVSITFTSLLAQMGNMMVTDKFHNSNITTYTASESLLTI